jgi:hypothetical protein
VQGLRFSDSGSVLRSRSNNSSRPAHCEYSRFLIFNQLHFHRADTGRISAWQRCPQDLVCIQDRTAPGRRFRCDRNTAAVVRIVEIAKVFSIQREQIECIKSRLMAPKQQITELRNSTVVQAHDLAINYRTCSPAFIWQGDVQRREGFELISFPGH